MITAKGVAQNLDKNFANLLLSNAPAKQDFLKDVKSRVTTSLGQCVCVGGGGGGGGGVGGGGGGGGGGAGGERRVRGYHLSNDIVPNKTCSLV